MSQCVATAAVIWCGEFCCCNALLRCSNLLPATLCSTAMLPAAMLSAAMLPAVMLSAVMLYCNAFCYIAFCCDVAAVLLSAVVLSMGNLGCFIPILFIVIMS